MNQLRSSLSILFVFLLCVLHFSGCESPVKPRMTGTIFFSTSFETDADTVGWQAYGALSLRNDAPPSGGYRSLFVSGGCIVPHAQINLLPAMKDSYLVLRCWGKNLDKGGSVTLSLKDLTGKQIGVVIEKKEWSEYLCADTLFVPKGESAVLSLMSGGIIPSSMLVDLIEVRTVR